MKNNVLIVVVKADCPSKEFADRIEEIRKISGVLGVRTIEAIAVDTAEPQYGGAGRMERTK